mgnify:CR=1 FL=1
MDNETAVLNASGLTGVTPVNEITFGVNTKGRTLSLIHI